MNRLGARIEPLRGLLYDRRTVRDLARVLAPPYDVISEVQQRDLYERSPYNVVRLELGRDADRYASAQATLREWIERGVLRRAEQPSIFLYTQRFQVEGRKFVRSGFVVRFRLEDFARGRVLPHEKTFPAPKEDRLKLLAATRTNISSIFGLYSGSNLELDRLRAEVMSRAPLIEADDSLGIRNELRAIAAPDEIATVQNALESPQVLIADGHHRYETSLNFRDECRTQAGMANPDAPYERSMMTFINTRSEGLTILPTHRVVANLRDFSWSLVRRYLEPWFTTEVLSFRNPNQRLEAQEKVLKHLADGQRRRAIAAYPAADAASRAFYVLTLRPEANLAQILPGLSPLQRELDVVLLHQGILEPALGITPHAVSSEANLTYEREAAAALEAVDRGDAQVAFLLNPVEVDLVMKVATAGEVMPQKSTDFYPKLLSGITMYRVAE